MRAEYQLPPDSLEVGFFIGMAITYGIDKALHTIRGTVFTPRP